VSEGIHPLIDQYRASLDELCRRCYVKRLELFGSATTEADPRDFDFLVEFSPDIPPGQRFDTYFEMLETLESLLQRPVDLVEVGAMRNPYFIRRVNESRREVYAA
jgi:predicted nucleotidyltransferase